MRKIPTVFLRDWDGNPRHVTREPNPECAWVFEGQGVATQKLDGTCVRYDGQHWWARREVKPGKADPPNFLLTEEDQQTSKKVGWEPAEQSGYARWIQAALNTEPPSSWPVGTYELCGPKINGNPEQYSEHLLIPHTMTDVLDDAPRDYDGLTTWLHTHPYEGIVWHHPDGRRMAKLKARDLPTEPTTPGRGDE
jgi:hypothetical protein